MANWQSIEINEDETFLYPQKEEEKKLEDEADLKKNFFLHFNFHPFLIEARVLGALSLVNLHKWTVGSNQQKR